MTDFIFGFVAGFWNAAKSTTAKVMRIFTPEPAPGTATVEPSNFWVTFTAGAGVALAVYIWLSWKLSKFFKR